MTRSLHTAGRLHVPLRYVWSIAFDLLLSPRPVKENERAVSGPLFLCVRIKDRSRQAIESASAGSNAQIGSLPAGLPVCA